MPTIEITYDKGNVRAEVNGVQGEGCLDLTKDILAHHGGRADTEMKPEFYEELTVDATVLCG
jgi:hypothetical protein